MSITSKISLMWFLALIALVSSTIVVIPVTYAQSSSNTTVEYTINANNRDAWSGDAHSGNTKHEVRINGYNSTNEPYEFISNDSDAESAAMQFQINVPKGATIQSATITVKAGSFQNSSPTGGLEIHLYSVANAQPFANGFSGDLLNWHPVYPQTVMWNANSAWANGSLQQTPNLAALVQTFVNRSDYTPGNYIGFVVTEGTIQAGRYYGWEDFFANGTPAKLKITYGGSSSATSTAQPATATPAAPTATRVATAVPTATAAPTATATVSAGQQTLTLRITNSGDDVNQDGSSNMFTNQSPTWLGTGASTSDSYKGLRFSGVTIPRNATITQARIEFYSTQSQRIAVSMQIAAENVGNSAAFSSSSKPSQRALTSQKVAYSANDQWDTNRWYQVTGLAPIIQSVVNRTDWQAGNALTIILKGNGAQYGRKFVQSYDGNPSLAARLVIEYR